MKWLISFLLLALSSLVFANVSPDKAIVNNSSYDEVTYLDAMSLDIDCESMETTKLNGVVISQDIESESYTLSTLNKDSYLISPIAIAYNWRYTYPSKLGKPIAINTKLVRTFYHLTYKQKMMEAYLQLC